VVLGNKSSDILIVKANGNFTFPTPIDEGGDYVVTIETQPPGQTCTVTNGSGTIHGGNVANVAINCADIRYTISGTVSGLTEPIVLTINNLESLSLASDGKFSFNISLLNGAQYNVTTSGSAVQACDSPNGSGTINGTNVTNVVVTCTPHDLWIWASGSNITDDPGDYGTQGVTAAGNVPGARYGAVSWMDLSGNFWLFGGTGSKTLNDLWKFDGTNWTWVTGSSTGNVAGDYGTQDVASASNRPGARASAAAWTDAGGNLWLFSGQGYDSAGNAGYLNDLWKYDGTYWTWIGGDNIARSMTSSGAAGSYGTKNVTAATNMPPGRSGATACKDGSGNLWLFGGYGIDGSGSTFGYFSDLWKFDGTNWTWVSGSNTINAVGNFGTQGLAAPTNVPGGLSSAACWTDAGGNFWLFGGYGSNVGSSGFTYGHFNTLWKFDGTNWTWVSGSSTTDAPGVYGPKGVTDSSSVPGARVAAASWRDANGNFWLFGGGGALQFSDLWMFDGTNWTWISGADTGNQPGSFGTENIADAGNLPGGHSGAASWIDSQDNLWLFGGQGYDGTGTPGFLNDLWRYQP